MNSEKVWLRWVREGSAYTITKSRRKKVRRERLRIVTFFGGYILLLIEQKRIGACFDYKRVKEYSDRLFDGYQPVNIDKFNTLVDQICKREGDQTLVTFCKIIQNLRFYNESYPRENIMREIRRESIYKYIAELKTPYAGAIVRRVFKEIETKLIREAAR